MVLCLFLGMYITITQCVTQLQSIECSLTGSPIMFGGGVVHTVQQLPIMHFVVTQYCILNIKHNIKY